VIIPPAAAMIGMMVDRLNAAKILVKAELTVELAWPVKDIVSTTAFNWLVMMTPTDKDMAITRMTITKTTVNPAIALADLNSRIV